MPAKNENTFDNFCLGGSIADSLFLMMKLSKICKDVSFSDIWFHNVKEKNKSNLIL